ncbi:MAG: hypothetical protein U0798_20160 [Gemmataceae bacterium]
MYLPPRTLRWSAACAAVIGITYFTSGFAQPQKGDPKQAKPQPGRVRGADLLKPEPRPKKEPLPPSSLPLQFVKGERIAFLGNSTAERMNLYGYFESYLQLKFPKLELVIRNFGRPAEEVAIQQRSADYTTLDDPLYAFNPDTFICFFGFNESFKGAAGVEIQSRLRSISG